MTILTEEQTTVQPQLDPSVPLGLETELSQTVPDLIDTKWIRELLHHAAQQAQNHYLYEDGEIYNLEELQNCFALWLDSCIDELTTYAFEFCVQDSLRSFNRHAFEMALLRIKPTEETEEVA